MITGTLRVAAIVLGIVLAVVAVSELDDWREGRRRMNDAQVAANADTARRMTDSIALTDESLVPRIEYVERWNTRTRIDTLRIPDTVKAVLRSCVQMAAECSTRRRQDSVRVANLSEQIRGLERAVVSARAGPRFSPSIAPGWSPMDRVPVLRAGAELRLFRKVSATATGDLTFYRDSIGQSAFVGLTYRFR